MSGQLGPRGPLAPLDLDTMDCNVSEHSLHVAHVLDKAHDVDTHFGHKDTVDIAVEDRQPDIVRWVRRNPDGLHTVKLLISETSCYIIISKF